MFTFKQISAELNSFYEFFHKKKIRETLFTFKNQAETPYILTQKNAEKIRETLITFFKLHNVKLLSF